MSTEPSGLYRLRPEPGGEPTAVPALETVAPEPAKPVRRIWAAMFFIGVFALVLVVQLFRYQVFASSRNLVTPGAAPPRAVNTKLPRGAIVDRNGHPLALERYEYSVSATPNMIRSDEERAKVAGILAPMLHKDPAAIAATLFAHQNAVYWPLGIADQAAGEEIMSWNAITVTAEAMPRRFYPEGRLASHVLGFVAGDCIGYYGVEGYYDTFLRASSETPRLSDIPSLEAADREAAFAALPKTPFVPSYVQRDLVLTLDRNVQYLVEAALERSIRDYRAEAGTVIVLEPRSSAIVAMASWPDFDPNNHTDVATENIYIDPAVSEVFEPGSVFKLVTYAGALDAGVITPQTKFIDTKVLVYGGREIRNWDGVGHGPVTAAEALAESLNVTTAQIAVGMGRTTFYKAVQRFGFGQKTGVELAHESAGIVKFPNKGNWYPADLAINSFGQGISVTPLQMANAVAAIASDGVLYRPHIVRQIMHGNQVAAIEPRAVSHAISLETARTLTTMMVATVKRTPGLSIDGYSIAGKSGTAEIPLPDGYVDKYTIASFVGFFPADEPQFVILVKLVRPKTSQWASYTAVPLFREVIQDLIQLYAIPPDAVRLKARSGELSP